MDGTTVIPLSYVIRDSVAPVPDPTAPILKQCVLMEPHHGPVYQEDNMKVLNTYRALIKDSQVRNTNVKIFLVQSGGRGLVITIDTYYRGQGILNHELIEDY